MASSIPASLTSLKKLTNLFKPMPNPEQLTWRENILSTVAIAMGYVGNEEVEQIPQVIIDAIDAAYVAGLDDAKAERKAFLGKIREEILEEAVDYKYINSADCIQKVLKILEGKE